MTQRPWIGASLALYGAGIMCLAGGTALSTSLAAPTVTDVLAYTIELTAGLVVAACAILAVILPVHHKALGYVVAMFSLLSLFGLSGAWCFGSLLGVFGATALLVWSLPVPAVYRRAEAFAIALTAVFFVHIATALAAIGPYPLRKFPPLELLPGVVAEGALLIGAVMVYRRPAEYRRWGAVLIVASLVAVAGPYFGFILGPVLGFAAGVTAIRWKGG